MRTEGPDRSATLGLVPQAPSNKSIDRAGTLLRDWWRAAGDKRMERSKWTIKSLDDYAVDPKPTGYRAVHVVVVREEHMIEVQLRTERQHLWASTVERFSARPGFEWLKDGNGPPVAVDFFRLTAEIMTLQDLQRPVDRNMMKQVDELRARLHDLAG